MEYPLGNLSAQVPSVSVKAEPDFEPMSRARSNTWPCPRPEDPSTMGLSNQQGVCGGVEVQNQGLLGFPKKSTSRRNAWGNMSYADLITQAIQSSVDKRLTLAQIYEWMVANVAYFKDKGDSNSSAGWKNSIRHNLSLHNRFMRVQNEGTGKSSWWMLNPDAKPGKAARRRATSMETSKFEKKRGRIKKKLEAIRNGVNVDTPSPSSSLSEGLDNFPESPQIHNFNLSPSDFRPRASSNASSCGRLSPILSEVVDLHDNQVPPMSPWDYAYYPSNIHNDRFGTEQLAGNLANTMKLHETAGSFDFHSQTFHQSQNFSGGAAVHRGSFSRSAAIPTTIRQNEIVQQQSDAHILNGMYGTPYSNSTAFPPTHAQIHQQSKVMSNSNHTELDFNLEELEPNTFGSLNVEEVLQGEQSLGEDFDFNFAGLPPTNHLQHNNVSVPSTTSVVAPSSLYTPSVVVPHHHHQQAANGRPWVH